MASQVQHRSLILSKSLRPATAALALAILLALTVVAAQAQTYKVLYNFTGAGDGGKPYAGLTMDKAGNLYGTTTTSSGGGGWGTVFRLSHRNSSWVLTPLYNFTNGGFDGAIPVARVIFGPDGTLYGTTEAGGEFGGGLGTVFNLRPSPTACKTALCAWNESVLHSFGFRNDGSNPNHGDLVFDQTGNIYGTTQYGGSYAWGTAYELTPSGGNWNETVLWNFGQGSGINDGIYPWGVILDNAGNLYGTSESGGLNGLGTAFQLTRSGSGWTENILYSFGGFQQGSPYGGLIFDSSGNLYGSTYSVFELSQSNGNWTFTLLYFLGSGNAPYASLAMDTTGNLYGTTNEGGAWYRGSVFKLTPSNGGWTYTDLYDFTGGSDGGYPWSNVTFDANGNLYGTASQGGAYGYGVVWEITPQKPGTR